jgi:hypothetical protein
MIEPASEARKHAVLPGTDFVPKFSILYCEEPPSILPMGSAKPSPRNRALMVMMLRGDVHEERTNWESTAQ